VDRDSGGRLRETGEGEGESEGRGGSVICVSAALGPSAHPLPFLATSATTPARPAFYPFNHPRSTLRTGTMSADVSAWFGMCVAYMCAHARMGVYMCRWNALALLCTSRLCITPYKHHLHILGGTLCAGYVANT